MEQQKFDIELVDSERFRSHEGAANLIIDNEKIIYEAISNCMFHPEDEAMPIEEIPYYIRQKYKKEFISGINLSNRYYEDTRTVFYILEISIIGAQDDILIRFTNRKPGYELYKKLSEWLFKN